MYWYGCSCLFWGLCFLFSHARIGSLIETGRETEINHYALILTRSFINFLLGRGVLYLHCYVCHASNIGLWAAKMIPCTDLSMDFDWSFRTCCVRFVRYVSFICYNFLIQSSFTAIDSISLVLFVCLFQQKHHSLVPIVFKFSGQLCSGLVYSPLWMRSFSQGFWAPDSLCQAFFGWFKWKNEDKKYPYRKTRPRRRLLLNLVFDFTTAFQAEIKQREQTVLEKWGKGVSWRRTFA